MNTVSDRYPIPLLVLMHPYYGVYGTIFRFSVLDLCDLFPPQILAKALLYISMNTAGLFIHYLIDWAQRQAFLETRRCIEGHMKLEMENKRQARNQEYQGSHTPYWMTLTAEESFMFMSSNRSVWYCLYYLGLLPWRWLLIWLPWMMNCCLSSFIRSTSISTLTSGMEHLPLLWLLWSIRLNG